MRDAGGELAERSELFGLHQAVLRGAQIVERTRKLLCAALDLVFQVGIGFLQPRAHVVELVGEAFQLVAGLDRDALGEIAAADALGAGAQGLDRADHAPRKENSGEHREDRRRQQHDREPLQRGIERGIGLLTGSSTNMVQPSGMIGAEAVSTSWPWMFIARSSQRSSRGLRRHAWPRAHALHLRQLRHVGVAQHQTDVGMGDQPALRADHIGVAVLADLDLRDHVPDQLQIDLGDADAGVLAGAGQRQRHVGLGLPAEIDRPVIDLVGDGLGEFRVLGEVERRCRPRPSRAARPAGAPCRSNRPAPAR